jgi:hypothetical protein
MVYFLRHKNEVFDYFHRFKSLAEKKRWHYIKSLRMDRGGEYIANEFIRFFEDNGIHKQFTTRHTPQKKK